MIRNSGLLLLVSVIAGVAPAFAPQAAWDLSTLTPNTWVETHPTYQGAPYGGSMAPQCWNNKGAYDPNGRQVIVYDRWVDSVHSGSIYANAALGFDASTNVVSVIKMSNYTVVAPCPANVLAIAPGCG